MPKTVFVTGGAGYVGSHCCKAFAQAGWEVVVYDNLSRGWRDFVRWGRLIEGDILDRDALMSAVNEVRPDAVAHFAALAYVAESVADPALYYRTNVVGTLNLADAMRAAGVGAVVFSSTCATYGSGIAGPIAETALQRPISPYGWSKLCAEQILMDYGAAYGLRAVALRYFNAAGADASGVIGERHKPESHLIPLAIRAAVAGDYELTINGNDFNTPDGTCIRDYIHVSDLANAHLRALDNLQGGGLSDAFNLGTGAGVSVLEIVASIERVTGATVRWAIGPRREGDPPSVLASATKANRVLGWVPQVSEVDTIIMDAWRWQMRDSLQHSATSSSRAFE